MPKADRRAGARASGKTPADSLLVYEALFETSPLSITVFDRDLVVRDVSRTAAKHAGRTRKSMRGIHLSDYLPEEYVRENARTLTGESVVNEHKLSAEQFGEEAHVRAHLLPLRAPDGSVQGGVTIVADVTDHRRAEELVEQLSFADPLTGLPNRRMLSMMLKRALSRTHTRQRQLALVWLNIDRFKDVNDALGREAGDALLQAVGKRLDEAVRANDIIAHIGGDDFILMLPRINSRRHLERLMDRLHGIFEKPFAVGKESVLLTASCGVAVHPDGGSDVHEIEEHAHTAMRTAKELGGGISKLYESELNEDSARRLHLVGEIRAGIDAGHFVLHYQPQIRLRAMDVRAVEALVRWEHPERGTLPPAEFVEFAEQTALIVPLGRHIFERACEHRADWHERLERPPVVAVNVSAREFQRVDICAQVQELTEATGLSPSAFEIEITETAVLADPERAARVVRCLRKTGVSVALDDFGTGYSSLTHLRELPIDRVKVDRSFVASCLTDRSAAAILVAVVRLAHELGLEVVAEGVETDEQLRFVRAVGCDAAQGYHLARPLPREECTEFLLRAQQGPVL